MKITVSPHTRSVLVDGLGIHKDNKGGWLLEPVFVLRAGDEYADSALAHYQSLASKNIPDVSRLALKELAERFKGWPKHTTDCKVRVEQAELQGQRLMEKPLAFIDGQLYEFTSDEVNEALKALLVSNPRLPVGASQTEEKNGTDNQPIAGSQGSEPKPGSAADPGPGDQGNQGSSNVSGTSKRSAKRGSKRRGLRG